jgi:hypothetical protein
MPTAVQEFLAQLDHPLQHEVQSVVDLIRAASPAIGEGIKWKVPSFHAGPYFATLHLRDPQAVQIILHRDAKTRTANHTRLPIDDPAQLLHWLGPDRASIKFSNQAAIDEHGPAFQAILRQWITHLG